MRNDEDYKGAFICTIIHLAFSLCSLYACNIACDIDSRFIELYGPALSASFLVAQVIETYLGLVEMNETAISQEYYMAFFAYLMYTGFMATVFWWHMQVRLTCISLSVLLVVLIES